MLPTENGMLPFRIIRAEEVGIRGTILEQMIRDARCIICGNYADREIWIYSNNEGENSNNKVKSKNFACSEECAEMVAWRSA